MNYIIKVDLPIAIQFIKYELNKFDLTKLEWFKMLPLKGNTICRGRCDYPIREARYSKNFKRHYRIRCSVNIKDIYPYTRLVYNNTWKNESGLWGYNTRQVTFQDAGELLVYVAGHEVYHFLRHSNQIPGRNTQVQADNYGLKWFDKYKDSA